MQRMPPCLGAGRPWEAPSFRGNGAAEVRPWYEVAGMAGAFDTLKLADRLEAAGMPTQQAKGVAAALAERATANLVTREYLDLRLGEIRTEIGSIRAEIGSIRGEITFTATKAELAEAKAEILRWIIGTIDFQTIVIIGAVAALIRLLH